MPEDVGVPFNSSTRGVISGTGAAYQSLCLLFKIFWIELKGTAYPSVEHEFTRCLVQTWGQLHSDPNLLLGSLQGQGQDPGLLLPNDNEVQPLTPQDQLTH